MQFNAGDHVRWFANQRNWPLRTNNIITEGELDVRYFHLAARLYKKESNLDLLGEDLSIFCLGIGDEGGTHGIARSFPPLFGLINQDLNHLGKPVFRAIVLLDSDNEGKYLFGALTGKYGNLIKYRDVFLLQRTWPRTSRDPRTISSRIEELSMKQGLLDCEIEDLIAKSIIDVFIYENSNCKPKFTDEKNGQHHYKFPPHAKATLCRFVEENAILRDVLLVVEALKALRFYLGLEPDGVHVAKTN